MSGLSLMKTRSFIDRLGDLDEEITKVCRAADVMATGIGKDHTTGVGRLKEACVALKEKQEYVREAKDCLLGLDGFMHALSGEMRQLMEHPQMGSALGRISEHMQTPLTTHVTAIVEETVDGLRRVDSAVKALRESKEDAKRTGSIKESAKLLSKCCGAAENAIKKALKQSAQPPQEEAVVVEEAAPEAVEEMVVEKAAAGETGFHGYELTAGLPPEFLENIKKKKEEASDKTEDDDKEKKGGDKKADSLTPGNESLGPKDEGEEDDGWVPGHRTTQKSDDEEEGKTATSDHGYVLTSDKSAKGKVPPAFLENIEKMKAKSKDKDDGDEDGDDSKKAGFHGYELVVDKSAKGKVPPAFLENIEKMKAKSKDKDDEDEDDGKKAGFHGYELLETPDHGYELHV